MELTQERIDELLSGLLKIAKRVRESIPHSNADGFAQTIVILGPNMEVATVPAVWRSEPEKYRLMRAVSRTANDTLAQAVILISDVRWVNSDKAAKRFGLPTIDEIGVEKWGELYKHEITTRYGGYLGNAPADLYTEAIVIIMKGPTLNRVPILAASYEKGPNDSIRWLPEAGISHAAHSFNLLPDWWC